MSSIILSSNEAAELAKQKLRRINELRNAALEKEIAEQMKRVKWKFPFKFVPRFNSREEVIQYLMKRDSGYLSSKYDMIMFISYGRAEEICNNVLKAAKFGYNTTPKSINISLEDMNYLT